MSIRSQIEKGSQSGQKKYSFNNQHNPDEPAQVWLQQAPEGLVLFVVFYTQACRWSQCTACNLPSKCSIDHISFEHIMAQIDNIFASEMVMSRKDEIKKLIISNNGSVLDEATFSSTALMYLMAKANICLYNLAVLTMETRPEYVDFAELEFLSRGLKEGKTPTELELAIGFEAYDETIRNESFKKGLSFEVFENFISKLTPFDFKVKCYFMQKPVVGLSDEDAIKDIHAAIDYLSEMSKTHNVKINMHLNPTYAAEGTVLADAFNAGQYTPPLLSDVVKAARHGKDKNLSVFLGLYDEGLAVPGGSFLRPGDEAMVQKLEVFNQTQDYSILDKLV